MDRLRERVKRIRSRDGDGCCWCGMLLRYPSGRERRLRDVVQPDDVTLEHLVPTSCGGTGSDDNLLLAHAACNNSRKTSLWVPRWYPPSRPATPHPTATPICGHTIRSVRGNRRCHASPGHSHPCGVTYAPGIYKNTGHTLLRGRCTCEADLAQPGSTDIGDAR